MSARVFIANQDGAGFGHVTDFAALAGHSATLLVMPGTTPDLLSDCIRQLHQFLALDADRVAPAGGTGPATGASGSLAISWSPGQPDVQRSKREGPLFGGQPHGPVALVVDADLSQEQAGHALLELSIYAVGPDSDFLEPLPVKRTLHHLGQIQGYTHDGMPMRGAGSTSTD